MKHLIKITFVLSLLATTLFTSCNDDDGYSLDKYWINYGTIVGDGYDFKIVLDNGATLHLSATLIPYYKGTDGQRVITNYTILSERTSVSEKKTYAIRLNNIYEVLTKKPVKLSEITDSEIGTAPINIVDEAWFTGKYLNINFDMQVEAYSSTKHFINLVYDDVNIDEEGYVNVTLRHNDYEERGYWAFGRVSFDISELIPAEGTEFKLRLHWTDYAGKAHSDQETFKIRSEPTTPPEASLRLDKVATIVE